MRILRNSPLINQPTGPVEINKNAPLADDLIFLYSGHENLDYVSGKVGIDTTSHSLLRDEIGLSYDHINKSNVRTFTHNYSVQNSYIVSLIYIKRSSFNDGRILSAANGTNERFQIHDDNANTKTGFVWWNDLPGFDARRLDTAVSLGNWERHCTFWYNVSAQEVVTSYCSHKTNTGAAPETSTATNAQLGLSYLD